MIDRRVLWLVVWPWMEYTTTESGEPRGMEETDCKICSGSPNGQPDDGIEKMR